MPELSLLDAIQALKRIPRTGWIHAGVSPNDVESVAEHSFGVVFLSMIMAESMSSRGDRIDISKTLKMAILHDLSESLTFDISKRYLDFIGEKGMRIKRELEDSANRNLLSQLPLTSRKNAVGLMREHESGKTIESQVVTAADKIDLLMQLDIYRQRGYTSPVLTEMEEKVTAEIKAMKNPVFTSILRRIRE